MVRLFVILVLSALSAYAGEWRPIRGIPTPPFGVTNVIQSDPASWPSGATAGYWYIEPAHASAVDGTNTYGYPDLPRLTVPSSTTPLTSPRLMRVVGDYTTTGNITLNTSNATPEEPFWLDGRGTSGTNGLLSEIAGGHEVKFLHGNFIVRGFRINNTDFRAETDVSLTNVAYLQNEFTKPTITNNEAGLVATFAVNWLVQSNWFTHIGLKSDTEERDVVGLYVQHGCNGVWVIDNEMYECAGDAFGFNATQLRTDYSTNLFYGRNICRGSGENDGDFKTVSGVVISENDFGGTAPSCVATALAGYLMTKTSLV